MLSSRFSLFGGAGAVNESSSTNIVKSENNDKDYESRSGISKPQLTLRVLTDKDVYRPGDSVMVTIEIAETKDQSRYGSGLSPETASSSLVHHSLLIEKLGFEFKGIEKLDTQWFVTQKPPFGSKEKRGEHLFMTCSTSSLVSNQILSYGSSKTYKVRTVLPDVLPPSYRGSTIRYLYYIKCSLNGRWLIMEDGISHGELAEGIVNLETRSPLQIWVIQKNNGLLLDDNQNAGIVPVSTVQLDPYWKEMNGESDWVRLNEKDDHAEEGYESHDEASSVSSYNPTRETIGRAFGSSVSLQSSAPRYSINESSYPEGLRRLSSLSLTRLSVSDVLNESGLEGSSPIKQHYSKIQSEEDKVGLVVPSPRADRNELAASEGFIRGRSYNIKVDNRVLLRFSPKNSDSTYYFSDTIGGTLTFFHDESPRRCLEVSITLEILETINPLHVHPSRKNSPTITKVQSDHHEVVADLMQTSFLFSIPMDGPMSFSTSHVSVQWVLRFEFFITPKNVDWRRYEHPLLVNGRDKSEWTLPITVHAPPPSSTASNARNEQPFSLEPLWIRP